MFKLTSFRQSYHCHWNFKEAEAHCLYIVTDRNGDVWGSDTEPYIHKEWVLHSDARFLGYAEYEGDWKDSLRKSPR